MPQDDHTADDHTADDHTTRGDHLEPPWAPAPRDLPPFVDCDRDVAGHRPHHIQARLSWTSPPEAWAAVVVMAVDGNEVTLADGDELLRCATHDAVRLAGHVRRLGPGARLNRRFCTLTIDLPEPGHRAFFSVLLPGQERTPCSEPA